MEKSTKIPKREIKVYYKTEDMYLPQLKYVVDEKKDEVACMATFCPTFEPPQPQEDFLTYDEPESVTLNNGSNFCFIFLVDRSGSMGGNRIEITKEALQLFI